MTPKAEKIIQLLNEGKTYNQIKSETGVSHTTIAKVIHQYPDLIKSNRVDNPKPIVQDKINVQVLPESTSHSISGIKEPDNVKSDVKNPGEAEKIKAENESLRKKIEGLGRELQNSHESDKMKDDQIQKLTKQLNVANTNSQKFDRVVAENTNLGEQVDKYIIENKNLRQHIKNLAIENEKLGDKNNLITKENITLKNQLKESKNDCYNLGLEFAGYKARILKEKLKNYPD